MPSDLNAYIFSFLGHHISGASVNLAKSISLILKIIISTYSTIVILFSISRSHPYSCISNDENTAASTL